MVGIAQVVEHLPSTSEDLNSSPSIAKKKMENPFIKWDSFGGGTKDSSLNFMIILNN
jgi:hypothetical protein